MKELKHSFIVCNKRLFDEDKILIGEEVSLIAVKKSASFIFFGIFVLVLPDLVREKKRESLWCTAWQTVTK